VCHRSYQKIKQEKQKTTIRTRKEKDKIIGNLEAEIVTLRKDIQKKNMQNSSKVLDDIINSQKSHLDKSRLGYNQKEKGSSSKKTEKETNPKSYAETIKEDRKITGTLIHQEDLDFRINNRQIGLKKKKDS
jgi:hypothetical protein